MPNKSLFNNQNRYKWLLFTLIVFTLLSADADSLPGGRFIYAFLFVAVIIAISININKQPLNAWTLATLGITALITNLVNGGPDIWPLASKLSAFTFFLFVTQLFGRNIFFSSTHTIDDIFGAICVYLLVGLTFAMLYEILHLLDPNCIVRQASGVMVSDPFDFYYFSFITLTTVGYGDIIPTDSFAKAIVIMESVTGLFYLAVLVASLMSYFITRNKA